MRDQFNGLNTLIQTTLPRPPGPAGPDGPRGAPTEVTVSQLDSAILEKGRKATGVSPLFISVSDPPTQAEVQAVLATLNELIAVVRREP